MRRFRSDHPHHEQVAPWLATTLADGAPFCVPDPVWVCFIRVVTSRRIFAVPADLGEAFDFVTALRAHDGYRTSEIDRELITTWMSECIDGQAGGDLARTPTSPR